MPTADVFRNYSHKKNDDVFDNILITVYTIFHNDFQK